MGTQTTISNSSTVTSTKAGDSSHPRKTRQQDRGVVIYGPQGCGKTSHATALARHYGKDRIVDDWIPGGPVPADTLVLTNIPHGEAVNFLDAATAAGIRLDAATAAGIRLMPALKRALINDRRAA